MADAMEMMILAILSPALHCEWQLEGWKQALITTVSCFSYKCLSVIWTFFPLISPSDTVRLALVTTSIKQ